MILVIDNYDSFVHNLSRYLRQLGATTHVVRNDAISVEEVRAMQPQAIVLSPGPCAPAQAGVCLELVRELHREVPILGICLGHQVIAEAFGGHVQRTNHPTHGRSSDIEHQDRGVFRNLPSPLRVGRYHSLVVSQLPPVLHVDAWLPDGTVMAVSHANLPIYGWQFHPESILTENGYDLLARFLDMAQIPQRESWRESPWAAQGKNNGKSDWFQKRIEYPRVDAAVE